MVKEYGGYLPVELPVKQEYYQGESVERLNCGRSAIYRALEDSGAKAVWLPYYICDTVIEPAEKLKIEVKFYNLDEMFEPINVEILNGDCILWANYFGIMNPKTVNKMVQRYGIQLIIDNTQAFYQKPVSHVYNVYSCRKFFGVSDGAYLIKEGLNHKPLPQDMSHPRIEFMFKCLEKGTNAAYKDHLNNEDKLAEEVLEMSPVTRRLLMSVDYQSIRKMRRANYGILHNLLGRINQLTVPDVADAIAYPFLVFNPDLRKYLIDNKIYVPQWWKSVLEIPQITQFERNLSQYLYPLPMDQRYNKEDMEYIAEKITKFLNG